MAFACDSDEPLDEMMGGGGRLDANAAVNAGDAAGGPMANDAGAAPPGNAGGGNASGGDAGGGNAGGGDTGGGSNGGADASAHNLDAGGGTGNLDAGSTGVIIGPSMRRDGGPPRWDPDAAGPILNAQTHTACMTLVQNLCTRVIDCQTQLAGLPASKRDQAFESCRNTFLASHNCNRATATASGFAGCSERLKTADCNDVFGTDFGSSCTDQLTFQR